MEKAALGRSSGWFDGRISRFVSPIWESRWRRRGEVEARMVRLVRSVLRMGRSRGGRGRRGRGAAAADGALVIGVVCTVAS